MKGGLAVLIWALLLLSSGVLNAIWAGRALQIGMFAAALFAVCAVAVAVMLRLRGRSATERSAAPQALPTASFAAMFTAIGLGVLVFGLVFGHFPIYLGAGMIVIGLGRLGFEWHAQHRALREELQR
jgi:hypothetical protein